MFCGEEAVGAHIGCEGVRREGGGGQDSQFHHFGSHFNPTLVSTDALKFLAKVDGYRHFSNLLPIPTTCKLESTP